MDIKIELSKGSSALSELAHTKNITPVLQGQGVIFLKLTISTDCRWHLAVCPGKS